MPSSTDAAFTRAAFPRLRQDGDAHQQEALARGHSAGYAAGYAAGAQAAEAEYRARADALEREHAALREQGRDAARHMVAVLNAAAEALSARTAPVLSEAEAVLAEAAVELAEAVLGYELADRGNAARSALARALAAAAGPDPVVTVRLNPGDLAVLDPETVNTAGVTLTADDGVAPGDAVAVLPEGYLDAGIGTALARAKGALLGDRP